MSKPANVRALALDFLLEVMERGGLSHLALGEIRKAHPELTWQELKFLTRLSEGTLERCLTLDYVLDRYSTTPVKKMKPVIRNLLRLSVYQILYLDSVPDSAACNEAVKLAAARGFGGLKGFVNGVLRRIAREKEAISWPEEGSVSGLSVRYSMPEWIVEEWLARYEEETVRTMLEACLSERPVTARIQRERAPGRDLEEKKERILTSLAGEGVRTLPAAYLPEALYLEAPESLSEKEAMEKGWITIQDESSMLAVAAAFLALSCGGGRRLARDVCASPGGKALFLADLFGAEGEILGCDISEEKCGKIRENGKRLGCENLRVLRWDAQKTDTNWIEKADIVIADLPCSGLGIMGKKNDIRYKASKDGCLALAGIQREMLKAAFPYVKPGGVLLYSTCTICREENEKNREFILAEPDFEPVPLTGLLAGYLRDTKEAEILCREETLKEGYLQLLPGRHACDGFFFAVFRKKAGRVSES